MDPHEATAGEEFVDDNGTVLVFEDYPTDGPLFTIPDEEPPFDTVQMPASEAEALDPVEEVDGDA